MAVVTIYLNIDRPLQPYTDGQQLTAAVSTHLSTDIVAHPEAVADWAFALGNQDLDLLERERETEDGETSFLTACLYRLPGFPWLGVLRRLRPARPVRRSTHLSTQPRWIPDWCGVGVGRFPCSLCSAQRRRSPTLPQRHRHEYAADFLVASRKLLPVRPRSSRHHWRRCAPRPAHIRQVRAGGNYEGLYTPVPHVLLSTHARRAHAI
ncbi:hypothetical protein [Dactylosporangium fulvum]|uniref:Uncharacterized protein n=1 Tax=Dactylosporangium fulvum TaxID=53359 RepID=A0ABY5VTL0_9ACTN|nr:hypothetical protein [Dactylosporangium fulvum]UWP80532.1 hypothetical protein Dfulv_35985 [Dactylosporangium fulvum]